MCCCWVRFVGYDVWFQEDFLGFLGLFVEDLHYFCGEVFPVASLGRIDRGHFSVFIGDACLCLFTFL